MYHVPLAFQCVYGHRDRRGGNGDREVRSGRILSGLSYVLCGELKEDLKAMVGGFVGV